MVQDNEMADFAYWWRRYGRMTSRLLLMVLVLLLGFRWYHQRQITSLNQASAAFESLMMQMSEGYTKAVRQQGEWLKQHYAHTVYASGAALLLAKLDVDAKAWQTAIKQCEWVLQHADSNDSVRGLALVYQARLLYYLHKYKQVVDIISNIPQNAGFVSEQHWIRGEALEKLGRKKEAQQAYKLAIQASPSSNTLYTALLRFQYTQRFG